MDIKVRELTKALGYREGRPIECAAIFIGTPEARRKERFKSLSVDVLRSEDEELQPELLSQFCVDVKNLKAPGG